MEALLGSLTGILGAFATKLFGWLGEREKNKHEIAVKRLDIEMMDKEWSYRERQAESEAAERIQVASYGSDSLSYASRVKPGKWGGLALISVDVIRGLIRPVLTLYLIWIVTVQHNNLEALLKEIGFESLHINQVTGIYEEGMSMVLFLACTAVAWWFGSRPPRKAKV